MFNLETTPVLNRALVILLTAIGGIVLINITAWITNFLTRKRLNSQRRMVINKALFYTGVGVLIFVILNQMGVNMNTLMGAAGIFGIAIGFASQTSVSNIISGLFMIGEQPFVVGDYIEVGSTRGVVISIDLLSIKLRTYNNRYIRIPNEKLIKAEVTNITRYPIRRIDLNLQVAYKEDLRSVIDLLKSIAKNHDDVLLNPEPIARVEEYADSGVNLLFATWVERDKFADTRSELYLRIKEQFDQAGIEIPFPHRKVIIEGPAEYAG